MKKTIVLASNNAHKLREIAQIFPEYEIISQRQAGFDAEVEETGSTFIENALIKARAACLALNLPVMADDSGICVEALGGAPGLYSARYAGVDGENADDEKNNDLLLKNLEGSDNRRAYYCCAIALAFPDKKAVEAIGYMHGEILTERHGTGGFGYDPIFRPDGYSVSVGEITDEEKNKISHRSSALANLLEKLKSAGI